MFTLEEFPVLLFSFPFFIIYPKGNGEDVELSQFPILESPFLMDQREVN
jgi:hypothetical protein